MNTTQILGKRDVLARWVVEPLPSWQQPEALRALESEIGQIFVRIRPDIKDLSREVRDHHAGRLAQLDNAGSCRFVVERVMDTSARRTRARVVEVYVDKPLAVSPKIARILLNPETNGHLVEECDANGLALYPTSRDGAAVELTQIVAPPRPGQAQLEAENAALRERLERLEALLAAGTPPKPKKRRADDGAEG